MLKTNLETASRSATADGVEGGLSNSPPRSPLGVVHCFVEPEELRRLLSIMAGTELVSEMIQTVLA